MLNTLKWTAIVIGGIMLYFYVVSYFHDFNAGGPPF